MWGSGRLVAASPGLSAFEQLRKGGVLAKDLLAKGTNLPRLGKILRVAAIEWPGVGHKQPTPRLLQEPPRDPNQHSPRRGISSCPLALGTPAGLLHNLTANDNGRLEECQADSCLPRLA